MERGDRQPHDWSDGLVREQTAAERRQNLAGVLLGLGWLAIPLLDTAGSSPAWWRVALAAPLFAIAVALYLTAMQRPIGCRPLWPVVVRFAAITAIAALLTVVVAPSWAILFSYAAVVSGLHLPTGPALLLLPLSAGLAAALTLDEGFEAAASIGVSVLGIGALMLALGRLIATNVQLQQAHARIEQLAVEAERERFARDLHDLLGHSLSVITLKAELAARLLPTRPAEAQRHVRELEAVARDALGEVRETVSGYRRPTLAGELAGARMALDAAGIELRLEGGDAVPELPVEVEALLAWTVREATTNVIRHSGARRCEIAIALAPRDGDGLAGVEIRDDGRGVGVGRADGADGGGSATRAGASHAAGGPGNGLDGLRERVAQLGGRLEAGPVPDRGFRLRVTVPAGAGEAPGARVPVPAGGAIGAAIGDDCVRVPAR